VTRQRAIHLIGIVVVLAMLLPFPVATTSVCLHGVPSQRIGAASHTDGYLHDPTAEEGAESQDDGSLEPCLAALDESVVPEAVPPAAGSLIAPPTFSIHRAPYLPAIFRPPIG
jgi:hypothetical protein